MPLKVNVGLARKVGEANYSSRGASVHVELELDFGLVNDPQKLQDRIRQLFGLVRSSLDEELNGNGNGNDHPENGGQHNGQSSGSPSNGSKGAPRPVTQSQLKAIFAICKTHGIDVKPILRQQFNLAKPEQLDIKQASELIDHLKQEGGGG
ncbi:MAG: hypothetical protein AB7K24_16290 [Gemmataceae bacterium]